MPRHILHDIAQRRCRARLHALAGAGQDIVGDGRLRLGLRWFPRRIKRGLKRANGIFKSQAVRFENFSGDASGVAHDSGEHDGAVDIAPAAAPRRGCCCFQNAPDLGRDAKRILRSCARLRALQNLGNDVAFDPFTADLARIEHRDGVRIVTKGRQQMLKRDLRRTRCAGKLGATRQRCRQLRRHRDLGNIWCRHAHDIS